LKEIAPQVTRAIVVRAPTIASAISQFAVIQTVAQALPFEVSPMSGRNTAEIDRAVVSFLRPPKRGIDRNRKRVRFGWT
jgi:hypothetical protein